MPIEGDVRQELHITVRDALSAAAAQYVRHVPDDDQTLRGLLADLLRAAPGRRNDVETST